MIGDALPCRRRFVSNHTPHVTFWLAPKSLAVKMWQFHSYRLEETRNPRLRFTSQIEGYFNDKKYSYAPFRSAKQTPLPTTAHTEICLSMCARSISSKSPSCLFPLHLFVEKQSISASQVICYNMAKTLHSFFTTSEQTLN